eukprot:sb/3468154/
MDHLASAREYGPYLSRGAKHGFACKASLTPDSLLGIKSDPNLPGYSGERVFGHQSKVCGENYLHLPGGVLDGPAVEGGCTHAILLVGKPTFQPVKIPSKAVWFSETQVDALRVTSRGGRQRGRFIGHMALGGPKALSGDCAVPSIDHGRVMTSRSRLVSGENLNVECDPGYVKTGQAVTCVIQEVFSSLSAKVMPYCLVNVGGSIQEQLCFKTPKCKVCENSEDHPSSSFNCNQLTSCEYGDGPQTDTMTWNWMYCTATCCRLSGHLCHN